MILIWLMSITQRLQLSMTPTKQCNLKRQSKHFNQSRATIIWHKQLALSSYHRSQALSKLQQQRLHSSLLKLQHLWYSQWQRHLRLHRSLLRQISLGRQPLRSRAMLVLQLKAALPCSNKSIFRSIMYLSKRKFLQHPEIPYLISAKLTRFVLKI